MGKKMNKQQG